MSFRDLSEFVSALEREGELVRVARPVGVELEITEIANRCMKSPGGGPALLFERPVLPGGAVSDVPQGCQGPSSGVQSFGGDSHRYRPIGDLESLGRSRTGRPTGEDHEGQ